MTSSQYFAPLMVVSLFLGSFAGAVEPADPVACKVKSIESQFSADHVTTTPYRGIRQIRFETSASDPADKITMAENFLRTLEHPNYLKAPRESEAVTRLDPVFDLKTKYVTTLDPKDPDFLLIKAEGPFEKNGDFNYVDLPNGTEFSHTEHLSDGTTKITRFVSPRGIREGFVIRVDLHTGAPATEQYLSDQIQYVVTYDKNGNILTKKAVKPLIVSTSKNIIVKDPGDMVFEDGRVSQIAPGYDALLGTLIADHAHTPGVLNYRNSMTHLVWDSKNEIYQPERDAHGQIIWHHLTPVGSDFKNGVPFSTGHGTELAVWYRPNSPKEIGKAIAKGYSIIRMSFPDLKTFLAYDANHLYEDMEHPEKLASLTRPHPQEVGVVATAKDIPDPYLKDPSVFKNGFGPGAKPSRVWMDANHDVFAQETLGSPAIKIDHVAPEDREDYVLKPGESNWLFLGHGLRYSKEEVPIRSPGQFEDGIQYRDYDGLAMLTDARAKTIKKIRPGYIGPTTEIGQGANSSIIDLRTHEAYVTGTHLMDNGDLHITYGSSDHGTGAAKINLKKFLREFSKNSRDSQDGLVQDFTRQSP